jgi:hypothetical protein
MVSFVLKRFISIEAYFGSGSNIIEVFWTVPEWTTVGDVL